MAEDQQLRLTRTGMIFSGVAAIGAVVAAIFGGLSLYKPHENMRPFTTHVDSPILASGGSLTFRSHQQWTCSGSPGSIYSSCSTTLETQVNNWSSDDLETSDFNGSASMQSINANGIIFYLRDTNGKIVTQNQVTLNASASGGISTVTVTVPNGASYGFVRSNANENPPDKKHYPNEDVIQYFDPTCAVHGTISPTGLVVPPNPIPACEHPGQVSWTNAAGNQSYICRHGACRIDLIP